MEFFKLSIPDYLNNYLIPCLAAFFCGGIIGFERERKDRPAGLRTHTLVCVGSAIFTLTSYMGFTSGIDPSRIAAGVVTGIGFIGAGVIFREGVFVRGVTTAASIWIVAAVGVAIGTKLYYLAFTGTVFAFFILTFIKILEDKMSRMTSYTIALTAREDFSRTKELTVFLEKFNSRIVWQKSLIEKIPGDGKGKILMHLRLESRDPAFMFKALDIVRQFEEIDKVEIL